MKGSKQPIKRLFFGAKDAKGVLKNTMTDGKIIIVGARRHGRDLMKTYEATSAPPRPYNAIFPSQ
ncbi:MAG: hypothetical protein IPL28_06415 [Chloroflexi bacterium]|nr:hypothetical protein [Chloroflexota bacterium]